MYKLLHNILGLKEGTISILFGCHSIVHSFVVIKAWVTLYDRWPKPWELGCIFLHDIGHYGLDYLSDLEAKKKHWEGGANIAKRLFGQKGYDMVAGHCTYSEKKLSKLYRADKYSWYIAPVWWMYCNIYFEPLLAVGYKTNKESVDAFRANVKDSIESGKYTSTHEFYLEASSK